MTFLPCKEMFDDCSKMVAGGGLALSLLMAVFISLLGTPAMTSAAENTPTSVSAEGSSTNGSFAVTVVHSNGLVTVDLVSVADSGLSGAAAQVVLPNTDKRTVSLDAGKFVELPGEPGVLISVSSGYLEQYNLSDIGYGSSTSCTGDNLFYCLTVALKDRPQTAAQIVQMPTTGAPTGLTTVGLAALGLCLLGGIGVGSS